MLIKSGKKAKKTVSQTNIDICLNFLKQKQLKESIKDFCYPAQFWITLIKVLQYTGIRRNQLLHIRICDVNDKDKKLFLREEGSKTHSEREIPLIDDVFNDIVELKKQLKMLNKKPTMQLFNIYHFKNNKCDFYKEMNFNRIDSFFQQLSKACCVRVSPHRFRHTLATNLMRHPDRNVTLVKELLGHSSLSTTLEYIVTDHEQLRSCLDAHFNQLK
ncbi:MULTISPECIES: site-specific integrase [unclassified Gilliamella]|uniref:site-specific integrase n=1 Tax=unclassified Gilliamella TaxID=2685620 RepID=UPI00135DA662|nr:MULTISPECIES: site-specific integrase [unclassified Gilliamella]MWP61574.1 tyrosine-type recombinase/integrase [Gilliamella sp. Pas-s25]NUF49593.1 site-specific integrase [Gilliamella sp. ESL0250]